jgi:superfamily II DNA or RNA helicase
MDSPAYGSCVINKIPWHSVFLVFAGHREYSLDPDMVEHLNLEFFRGGYGMLADARDNDPGAAFCFPQAAGGHVMTGSCSCRTSRKKKDCPHFSLLIETAQTIKKQNDGRCLGELFIESAWFRLASLLSEGDPIPCTSARAGQADRPSGPVYVFTRQTGALLARLLDHSPASLRFLERAGKLPERQGTLTRADLLQKLAAYQSSEEEQLMNQAGMLTRRQAAEQSFWGLLAYHAYREYGGASTFHPSIDESTGDFLLACLAHGKDRVIELSIPRPRVRRLLAFLAAEFPRLPGLAIHPIPLKSIFRVTEKTKLDLEVRPFIQALQASGEARFFAGEDFARFRYGDLVYIKEMKVLAELERPDAERRFASPVSMHLKKSQLPSFLDEHKEQIAAGSMVLDGRLRELEIYRDFDRLEISLEALQRSWYWLSVRYGFGSDTVSLADIRQARREGKSYLETRNGWIDLHCEAFQMLDHLGKQAAAAELKTKAAGVPVSAMNLLRLMATFGKSVQVTGEDGRSQILRRLLSLAPAEPWEQTKGLATTLRPYQRKGVDWLRFLFDNELSGLLCDDMGLGKTHQAMALMVWLKEKQKIREPFLVVCPTTVISHWRDKLREHAPGLKPTVYHGGDRTIKKRFRAGEVLLTSYGILRNDILSLRDVPFSLAVFDELQNLKNRETQSYQAASLLQARMRLGLTGTPIENSLGELKSLFDLVLPGYLGTDEEYAARYTLPGIDSESPPGLPQLRKLIAPFTLRRLKKDVLEELPEKIEDLRTCQLSEMQVGLYRDALATKGASLLSQLESCTSQLPYIHIFALLNLLKRICDHPALVVNKIDEYQSYQSGKWDLFQELLFETLDSGQKIVVFTQYLGMIAIMERLVRDLGVGFVTLTGSSQDRGEIVRRFNTNTDCRVFLGSLKAGGTGIDLIGGSTVLHYDRWWNAAREDQATDRVHRIGQKRAVQVFKLVTEGTLEEKISAIIERKRRLMNAVVQADDPKLSKIFTRAELIELLRPV